MNKYEFETRIDHLSVTGRWDTWTDRGGEEHTELKHDRQTISGGNGPDEDLLQFSVTIPRTALDPKARLDQKVKITIELLDG